MKEEYAPKPVLKSEGLVIKPDNGGVPKEERVVLGRDVHIAGGLIVSSGWLTPPAVDSEPEEGPAVLQTNWDKTYMDPRRRARLLG